MNATMPGRRPRAVFGLVAVLAMMASMAPARAEPVLEEVASFFGEVLLIETGVPAVVVGVVRGEDSVVVGFGETVKGSGTAPDGKTVMRIGSITKAFAGQVLASLVIDGTVALSDPLASHLDWGVPLPERDGHAIRLIDLVTHSAGLPREVPHEPGPENDPFATITQQAFTDYLRDEPLLFSPGSSILYSNFGFDLLAAALSQAAGQPYPQLLKARVTGPLGMSDTGFQPDEAQEGRLMQGHGFAGEPLPHVPSGEVIVGSGGLYTTADDMVTWLRWHLDRFAGEDAELRLVDHGLYRQRDGLEMVFGMDESGHMDAMGLGWVAMMPEGNRPFILQKAGGLQGVFSYVAFAPTRGVGVFVAINQFDFGAASAMAAGANDLIAVLANR